MYAAAKEFFKLDGAGNDFVGLDCRGYRTLSDAEEATLARELCHRHHGIGADGLLLIRDASRPGLDFDMRYRNADGSLASMCGNGARCIAVFAHARGAAGKSMRFLTDAGEYRADIVPEGARIYFPDIPSLPRRVALTGPLKPIAEVEFLLAGVPHAVVFTEDLADLDVGDLGRPVRFDPALAPEGANVNFAELKNGIVHVRTYERGVEGETRACGTGAVATACVHAHRAGLTGTIRVHVLPTGGIPLTVQFTRDGEGYRDIALEGAARIVFRGEFMEGIP